MKLAIILALNPNLPFSTAANSLGHVCLGISKRILEPTSINIMIRTVNDPVDLGNLRALMTRKSRSVVDFTESMTHETYKEQLARTATIATKDHKYYCIGFTGVSHDDVSEMEDYFDKARDIDFSLEVDVSDQENKIKVVDGETKMTIVVDKKSDQASKLRSIAAASILSGMKLSHDTLGLIEFVDADGTAHQNISKMSYIMKTAPNDGQLQKMIEAARDEGESFVSSYAFESSGTRDSALFLLGDATLLMTLTKKGSLLKE